MPISITNPVAEANSYGHPFVGPGAEYTDVVLVDISDLGSDEVDEFGYIKPGLPLKKDGNLIGSGDPVYGVTLEAIKIATGNTDAILDAATDCHVAVGTHGIVNRDIAEDNLGRAYTADEIAAFAIAGSHLHLTRT
jgi:hypothetical protein